MGKMMKESELHNLLSLKLK